MTFKLTLLALCLALQANAGTPSAVYKFDHFGWRPADAKAVRLSVNPGASLQLRQVGSNTVVFTVPSDGGSIASLGVDAHAGHAVWRVDFSAFNTPAGAQLNL